MKNLKIVLLILVITVVLVWLANSSFGFVAVPVLAALLFTWQGLSILFLGLVVGGLSGFRIAQLRNEKPQVGAVYGVLLGVLASIAILLLLLSNHLM